jgi:hypothetical protein
MAKSKPPRPTPDVKQMYQLAEHYSEASRLLDDQARGDGWGCSAPQMLIESFAVELYLKCLYVLDMNAAPPFGHDWEELFHALRDFTRDAIREQFKRTIDSHPVLANLAVINPEAVKTTDFNRALKTGKNTFDQRRYLYEPLPTGEWFYAKLLREAIQAVTKMDIRLNAC